MKNRFADIDLSFKRLSPVYGYRSQKLVPIEKALEPVESEIDELSYYIKTAKKYCHFPSEHGLTHDESAAIFIYTMEWGDTTLYRVLNKALRSENRQALKIWFPYLKLFDTALDKIPTTKEVVWRGIDLDIGKNFTKNQLVTWWSVSSCSSSVNVIKDFLGNDKNSTLFLIETVNGKNISGYTEYENEDEIILRIGTQFRVKCDALEQPNGSHIVHLIEIDNNDEKPLTSPMNEMHLATKSSNQGGEDKIDQSANVNDKDVQIKHSSSNENTLKSITNQIICFLELNSNKKKDEILNDLLVNGRQSLNKYEEYLLPDIYTEAMNRNDNELMKYLGNYFEQKWKIQYSSSNKWFIEYVNEYKCSENKDLYKQVLIRTAEYGNKFLKNCSILSIILQLLFEGINDYYLKETNIFNELWFTITTDGLKSIEKYSDYITEDLMNEQINKKQSILFQALREYYHQDLSQLLQQCNIANRQNLYDLVLDNVAEFGWKIGLQTIQKKIIPNNFKILLEKLDSFLKQRGLPVFVTRPATQKVKQGETAVFKAKIDGYPTPNVTWLLNGKPLTAEDDAQVEVNALTGEIKLSIPKVDVQQHAGLIICRLENEYGSQEETFRLYVFAAPLITTQLPKQEEIIRGKDITLWVVVRGLPRPEAQWFYNDTPIALSNTSYNEQKNEYQLSIKKATVAANEGTYRVSLKNEFGQTESTPCLLTVLEPVKLTKTAPTTDVVDLKVNEPFEISADIEGKEAPKVQLTKDGKEVGFTSVEGTRYTYSVPEVKPKHQGLYKLTAKNKASTEETNITLNVIDPRLVKIGTMFGADGGSPFDDSSMISFTSSHYLCGIVTGDNTIPLEWCRFLYSSADDPKNILESELHGTQLTANTTERFILTPDERINKVQVVVDDIILYVNNIERVVPLIRGIRFFTTKERASPSIDDINGKIFTEQFDGYTVGYVTGRSGLFVDQLQFHWYHTATD